jgi:hypothetical protein
MVIFYLLLLFYLFYKGYIQTKELLFVDIHQNLQIFSVFSYLAYPAVFIDKEVRLPKALKILRESRSSFGVYSIFFFYYNMYMSIFQGLSIELTVMMRRKTHSMRMLA